MFHCKENISISVTAQLNVTHVQTCAYLKEISEAHSFSLQRLVFWEEEEGGDTGVYELRVLVFPGEFDQVESLPAAVAASKQGLRELLGPRRACVTLHAQ